MGHQTCVVDVKREDDTRRNKCLPLANDTNLGEVCEPYVMSQTNCMVLIKQIEKKDGLPHMHTQYNSTIRETSIHTVMEPYIY